MQVTERVTPKRKATNVQPKNFAMMLQEYESKMIWCREDAVMDDFEFFRYAIKKNKKLTVLIDGYNVIISKELFNLTK